jgi:hypothetical protein
MIVKSMIVCSVFLVISGAGGLLQSHESEKAAMEIVFGGCGPCMREGWPWSVCGSDGCRTFECVGYVGNTHCPNLRCNSTCPEGNQPVYVCWAWWGPCNPTARQLQCSTGRKCYCMNGLPNCYCKEQADEIELCYYNSCQ